VKSAFSRTGLVHAAGLAALLGAESLLFLTVARQHYAWSYPRWNDQVQYLGQAYNTYDLARSDGYVRAAWGALNQVYAQGSLHEVLTLPIFAAVGASRTAALAVNMLAFIAWQAATFMAVYRISGRTSLAWASVGLLAALHFPWSGSVGSAVDFRLDWMAACAYGVTLCLALSGRGFRSAGWACLFGAAVGATVLLRFLTLVYFGLIFFVLLAWLLTTPEWRGRCGRLVLSGAVALLIVAPTFWRSRHAIYSYYWIGHIVGPERALRDSHLKATASAWWTIKQVVTNQVGLAAVALGLGAAVLFLLLGRASGARERPAAEAESQYAGSWVLAFAFFAAPALVLALHPEKSDPPSSILIPGAVWAILLLWIGLARRVAPRIAAAVGAGALAVGVLEFVHAELKEPDIDREVADSRKFNALSDYLFFRAEEAGLTHPLVGVTWVLDGLDAKTLRVIGYERHGRSLDFAATLPTGLFPTSQETVMKALVNSDFVCLVTRAAVVWPFDSQMEALLPSMRGWCDGHMRNVGHLDAPEFSATVYEKAALVARAGGVDLASSLADASRAPAYGEPSPPAAPFFTSIDHTVGSTRSDFRFQVLAAYSPVRFDSEGLPEGLTLNGVTGDIRGRFSRPGVFSAEVRASNRVGSVSEKWRVHVEDSDWFAFLDAPRACSSSVPFDVEFGAYDEGATLDFIDVTDLTTRKTLERIPVKLAQKRTWSGNYRLKLVEPGPHLILMRFARFDPDAKDPYSFVDHAVVVDVRPRT
jgi:hypothetical protein